MTFSVSGVDSDAGSVIVLTVGSTYHYDNLPSAQWFDSGTSYTWANPITVGANEQFTKTAGSSGTITAASTISATYQKQWKVTFTQSGIDADGAGLTVFTCDSVTYNYDALPTGAWVNDGASYSWTATVNVAGGVERFTTSTASGTVFTSGTVSSATYQKQWRVSFAQSGITSDGSGLTCLTVDGVTFSEDAMPTNVWVRNTAAYSWTSPVNVAGGNERFITSTASGTVTTSGTISTGNYQKQWKLTNTIVANSVSSITLSPTSDSWYNSGASVSIVLYNIYNAGSGVRDNLITYTVDSSTTTVTRATSGTVALSAITMDQAHSVTDTGQTQWQLTLDATATSALNSITSPSISGDSGYWYDAHQTVTVSLNGVWGQVGNTGNRLTAYNNGGGSTIVSTSAPVTAYSTTDWTAAVSITATSMTQYKVTFGSSGLNADATNNLVTWNVDGGHTAFGTSPITVAGGLIWVDTGATIGYTFGTTVSSSVSGKQYRFISDSPGTGFTVSGGTTVTGTYLVQWQITPYYTLSDASSPTITSVVHYTSNGAPQTATPTLGSVGGTPFWADAGTPVTYDSPIAGITGERWQVASGDSATHTAIASVTGSGPATVEYYHQYLVTFGYSTNDPLAASIDSQTHMVTYVKLGVTYYLRFKFFRYTRRGRHIHSCDKRLGRRNEPSTVHFANRHKLK